MFTVIIVCISYVRLSGAVVNISVAIDKVALLYAGPGYLLEG